MTWSGESPTPLFKRLDLEEILASEQSFVDSSESDENSAHGVKGGKKSKKTKQKDGINMNEAPEGTTYLNFETFIKWICEWV